MTAFAAAAATTVAGCDGTEEPPLRQRLDTLAIDLQVGSRGDDVRALHEHLTRIGYFPNDDLAARYSQWRPLVTQSPADAAVFDARTADAVKALQVNSGLSATGVVDEATREILRHRSCGVPDGIPRMNLSDKFAQWSSSWSDRTLTYKVTNTDDGLAIGDVRAAATAAFTSWQQQTSITFTQETGAATADIQITFRAVDGAGGFDGQAVPPASGGDISMDTATSWSVTNDLPATDVQTVLVHEIGHALGLDHSSISGATMRPTFRTATARWRSTTRSPSAACTTPTAC